jgi:pimeloyl-ACP methyl ester carboxylesterase
MSQSSVVRPGVVGLVLAVAGCGSSDHEYPSGPAPVPVASSDVGGQDFSIPYVPDARVAPPGDLTWRRCSLITGSDDNAAECATVEVPLDWSDASSQPIELFVKRYRNVPTPRGQLWLLSGGPGGSGADFESYVLDVTGQSPYPVFSKMAPDLEVYLLDHRGTGRSTRLGCDAEESADSLGGTTITATEWPTCQASLVAQWGAAGLAGFSISGAARDLGELVGRTRHGTEPVFVYAVSYGTLWAQRYLAQFPDQPSGVVLDSICAPGECQFGLRFDQGFHQIGQELFAACETDATCNAALAPDAWTRLGALYQKLDTGYCAESGFDRTTLRESLGFLLTSWALRDYIPAVLARLDRCNADDATALAYLLSALSADSSADTLYSQVLNVHIVLSELMENPAPTLAAVQASVAGLYLSLDAGPGYVRVYEQGWPTYPSDPAANQYAATSRPLLMLSGQLDPQTPPAVSEPIRAHYTAPNQTFVSVPYAAHCVLDQSPLTADAPGTDSTCGESLIRQFLTDPTAPLDQACLGVLGPPDFTGTQTGAQVLFGQSSVWGGASALSRGQGETRALERARRSVVRHLD